MDDAGWLVLIGSEATLITWWPAAILGFGFENIY
jgi:hypothetical protein